MFGDLAVTCNPWRSPLADAPNEDHVNLFLLGRTLRGLQVGGPSGTQSPTVSSPMRPNFRFGPRGACAQPDCPEACVGFVAENSDGSPRYNVCERTFDFDSLRFNRTSKAQRHLALFVTTLGWLILKVLTRFLKIPDFAVVLRPMDCVQPFFR